MLPVIRAAIMAGAFAFVLPEAVLAQSAPPSGAMAASDIVRSVEQRADFARLREVEWDEDGYWEVEFVARDGSVRKLRLDPVTGQPRRG